MSAHAVVPAVSNTRLEVKVDDHTVSITPWPKFLPQRFGKQEITGSREMAPAGPIDRLSFSRLNETRPWLLVGNGARPSTRLVGEWRLQLSNGLWSVSDGVDIHALGHKKDDAAPVMIRIDRQRWCVYLIEARMPARPQAGIAGEDEPQLMWAAWKIGTYHKHCPAQR